MYNVFEYYFYLWAIFGFTRVSWPVLFWLWGYENLKHLLGTVLRRFGSRSTHCGIFIISGHRHRLSKFKPSTHILWKSFTRIKKLRGRRTHDLRICRVDLRLLTNQGKSQDVYFKISRVVHPKSARSLLCLCKRWWNASNAYRVKRVLFTFDLRHIGEDSDSDNEQPTTYMLM